MLGQNSKPDQIRFHRVLSRTAREHLEVTSEVNIKWSVKVGAVTNTMENKHTNINPIHPPYQYHRPHPYLICQAISVVFNPLIWYPWLGTGGYDTFAPLTVIRVLDLTHSLSIMTAPSGRAAKGSRPVNAMTALRAECQLSNFQIFGMKPGGGVFNWRTHLKRKENVCFRTVLLNTRTKSCSAEKNFDTIQKIKVGLNSFLGGVGREDHQQQLSSVCVHLHGDLFPISLASPPPKSQVKRDQTFFCFFRRVRNKHFALERTENAGRTTGNHLLTNVQEGWKKLCLRE